MMRCSLCCGRRRSRRRIWNLGSIEVLLHLLLIPRLRHRLLLLWLQLLCLPLLLVLLVRLRVPLQVVGMGVLGCV